MYITYYTDYLASLNNYSSTFDRKTDDIVLDIIQNVRQNGDTVIVEYSKIFDNDDKETVSCSDDEIYEAKNNVSVELITSMNQADQNIQNFNEKQVEQSWYFNEQNGIMPRPQVTALDRFGSYVPCDREAFPSTV